MPGINFWISSATVTTQKVYTDCVGRGRGMRLPGLRRALHDCQRQFRSDWPETRQGAEKLANAPSLGDATSWSVRRISVTNLGNLAQTVFIHAKSQRLEPAKRLIVCLVRPVMHTQVGFDKGPEQPRPDRPLMVRRVASVSISTIMPHIARVSWSQCAQPE